MEEKALVRALTKLRPRPASTAGPVVSIVVTNRDGEGHLQRLLHGLTALTRYRSIELVLVDNGSTDGSLRLFDKWDGAKHLVANTENRSFSASNNQGIRAASGDLILLANNDIEPIHPDWLGYMVESLVEDVAAVGAMLVHPRRPDGPYPPAHPDLTIQHLGTRFEVSTWGVRAVNLDAGLDPLSITKPARRDVPAVTAACLLARRSDLLETPLDEDYWYGSEDWDLCLRLGERGRVLIDERAVLFHHEFGTQDRYMSEGWLQARTRNHQWFNALWGPALMRKLRTEVSQPPSAWFYRCDRAPRVALITGDEDRYGAIADQLRSQAVAAGWTVTDEERRWCDVAVAISPPRDVHWFSALDMSVAVVIDQEGEWARSGNLDAAKHVLVPDMTTAARVGAAWGSGIANVDEGLKTGDSAVFARLVEATTPSPNSMRIGVSTCAPDWHKAQFWGDTHLARGLMRSFRRFGHETAELITSDWRGSLASSCDVVIHLRGLHRRPVARGQWNLLWVISHPDRLERGECDDYDLIATASHGHAEKLSVELGRTVHYLPQGTDADTFKVGVLNVDYEAPVLYVGNARWPHRRAPRWLMRNGRRFHLYGKFWENFPEAAFVRGEYIANQDLASAYRSAGVVVADHHGSMRTSGFVANRLFDVLASGGVVLSDDVTGLGEIFGDVIPTYSDARELEAQLQVLLGDPALRRRLAADGRQIVMSGHTLDHRARQWLELLDQL